MKELEKCHTSRLNTGRIQRRPNAHVNILESFGMALEKMDYYKSFEIIARLYKGEHKAKAWFPYYKEKCEASGGNIEDAIFRVKLEVDAVVEKNIHGFKESISAAHAEEIKRLGLVNYGLGSIKIRSRSSACHKCKRPVYNTYDIECLSCGWIVCARCGSCGCGCGYAGKARKPA